MTACSFTTPAAEAWLSNSLNDALIAKDYIDERNDIYYGTSVAQRPGPSGIAGERARIQHQHEPLGALVQRLPRRRPDAGCASGYNRIVMFKSCYPISDVSDAGTEPGDPFVDWDQTIANYKAVYRHFGGPGSTYPYGGSTYLPLEDIFAANPDILFIPVTAPSLIPGETNDDNAHRARQFNNWLKNEWLPSYHAANPGLDNVAVLDWFNFLAYPDDHPTDPSQTKSEYRTGDSHPNATANSASTVEFITKPGNFLDSAWTAFSTNSVRVETSFFLQSGYDPDTGKLSTTLRDAGLVPLQSPYPEDPRTVAPCPPVSWTGFWQRSVPRRMARRWTRSACF